MRRILHNYLQYILASTTDTHHIHTCGVPNMKLLFISWSGGFEHETNNIVVRIGTLWHWTIAILLVQLNTKSSHSLHGDWWVSYPHAVMSIGHQILLAMYIPFFIKASNPIHKPINQRREEKTPIKNIAKKRYPQYMPLVANWFKSILPIHSSNCVKND